jgi:hypothetical protein
MITARAAVDLLMEAARAGDQPQIWLSAHRVHLILRGTETSRPIASRLDEERLREFIDDDRPFDM